MDRHFLNMITESHCQAFLSVKGKNQSTKLVLKYETVPRKPNVGKMKTTQDMTPKLIRKPLQVLQES